MTILGEKMMIRNETSSFQNLQIDNPISRPHHGSHGLRPSAARGRQPVLCGVSSVLLDSPGPWDIGDCNVPRVQAVGHPMQL